MEMLPVNWVAQMIVRLALEPNTRNRVYHIAQPREHCPSLRSIAQWMRGAGFPLETCDYAEWCARVEALGTHELSAALPSYTVRFRCRCRCRGAGMRAWYRPSRSLPPSSAAVGQLCAGPLRVHGHQKLRQGAQECVRQRRATLHGPPRVTLRRRECASAQSLAP